MRGIRGALLAGIVVSTVLGLVFGMLDWPGKIAEWPGSAGFSTIGDALAPSNLSDALTLALIPTIFALFMTDFFDTIGTAMAVGTAGGLVDRAGRLPGLRRVLLVDSAAAAVGGAMGTSSVTTYVESGAGVSEGARTGFASLVTAGLFLLAVPFVPLMSLAGQQVPYVDKTFISPAVAPALVLVGYLMMRLVANIDWSDPVHALPAFLIIAGVPMTFSISAGIGFGVIGYVVVMAVTGRAARSMRSCGSSCRCSSRSSPTTGCRRTCSEGVRPPARGLVRRRRPPGPAQRAHRARGPHRQDAALTPRGRGGVTARTSGRSPRA